MPMYPTISPAITLDFQKSKQLDPRILFSRSSTATYVEGGVIKYADEHQARFEAVGLLIEEARTNSVTTSSDVKTAAGAVQNGISSYVTGIAPDGSSSTTLTNWVPDSGSTSNALYGIANPAPPAAASVFIKANGWNYAGLWFNNIDGNLDGRIFIDLTTGEVLGDANMSSTTVVKCANGWWRVGGSSSTNRLGTLSIQCCSSSGSNVTPAMNGTDGILVWGLQVEQGSFSTSYIPTAGGTVTRAADLADITGTNFSSWYQPFENSMLIKFSTNDISTNSKAGFVTYDSALGAATNSTVDGGRAFYYVGTDNYIQAVARTPQSTRRFFNYDTGYNPLGQFNTAAQGYAGTDAGCAVNGIDPSFSTSASLNPGTVDSMWIGRNDNVSMWLNGHISRIAYYPRRLSDANLEAITS